MTIAAPDAGVLDALAVQIAANLRLVDELAAAHARIAELEARLDMADDAKRWQRGNDHG